MSDQASESLLVRAKRLTSLARQAREGQEAVQDLTRTETALTKLESALNDLEAAVRIRAKLIGAGVTLEEQPDLAKAPRELERHIASVGRPTPQLLNARAASVAKSTKTLVELSAQVWAEWSRERLSTLPIDRVARLGFEKSLVESRLDTLKRIAGAPPTSANVDIFVQNYDAVEARLAKVASDRPLDELLARFPCHLDELSDADLRLLRVSHPDIGAQIMVRFE